MRGFAAAATLALLAGCAAGPAYQRPAVEVPAQWQVEAPWRVASPDDAADKGPWWQRYGDPQLDALQRQAQANNPTLAIAAARLAQARAVVDAASAGLFPQASAGARAARLKISENRPLTNYAGTNFSTVQNDYTLSFTVAYELDLAGRVRKTIEGAQASAEQSAADFANTRLVLSADLAANYFNLRSLDTELDVIGRSIGLQQRALEIVSSRRELGATSGLEVAQQQALLDATLTQVELVKRQRAQFEHALATLTGTPAPSFSLPPAPLAVVPPPVPIGVPSDVLERRPDVAAAERAMAAANAQVGVAQAAFFPSISLAPSVGLDSRSFGSLFDASSLLWSLGASIAGPVFDGGRLRANQQIAQAGYDATVATYRRVVLTAMQEVEDGITGASALERASTQAAAAVASSRRVLDMATVRYEGGATTYLDVITAQQSLLVNERQAAQLRGQQAITSVLLVKALGGGYPLASP